MTTERAIEYALLEEGEPEPPMLVAGQRPPPDEQAEKLPSRELRGKTFLARSEQDIVNCNYVFRPSS